MGWLFNQIKEWWKTRRAHDAAGRSLKCLLADWLFNRFRRWWKTQRLRKKLENEWADESLMVFLGLMRMALRNDKGFWRKNIPGFKGNYQFMTLDKSHEQVHVAVTFDGKGMKVQKRKIKDADVTVEFENNKALANYLIANLGEFLEGDPTPDVLERVLHHKVRIEGNINYIMKFLYMANHAQLFMTGGLPQYEAIKAH